jgi:hypothetical protein
MIIGPLRSYQDVYVAACGAQFTEFRLGIQHERECLACKATIGEWEQDASRSGGSDEQEIA